MEISNSEINLYLQILLYKFAKFCIVTQSGPAGYASIIDTPFLLTNSVTKKSRLVSKKKDSIIFKRINYRKKIFFDNTSNEILNATMKIERSQNKIINYY